MPVYRVFFLDPQNRVNLPAKDIAARDDEDATAQARQYIDGRNIELWEGPRFIASLPHVETKADDFRKRAAALAESLKRRAAKSRLPLLKKKKALTDMADNEDWLDGRATGPEHTAAKK